MRNDSPRLALTARIAPLALLAAAAMACSSSGDAGPGAVVRDFYQHLDSGDYPAAQSLYSTEAMELWEDPDLGMTFEEWAGEVTREGTLDRIDVKNVTEADDSATVDFSVVYDDGSSQTHNVVLILEEGQWKMRLIR